MLSPEVALFLCCRCAASRPRPKESLFEGTVSVFMLNLPLHVSFCRECIECKLFNSGRLADNQTCQKHCKDEIITTVDVLGKWAEAGLQMVGASDCGVELLLPRPGHTCEESLERQLVLEVCVCVCSMCVYMGYVRPSLWAVVCTEVKKPLILSNF